MAPNYVVHAKRSDIRVFFNSTRKQWQVEALNDGEVEAVYYAANGVQFQSPATARTGKDGRGYLYGFGFILKSVFPDELVVSS